MRLSLGVVGLALVYMSFTASAQQSPSSSTPTFSKDVAPILFTHCVSCHRPGEMAPMSLLTFTDVRPWAKAIRDNVARRTMPPWHATKASGPFENDRSLSDADIETIVRWVDSGAPEGQPGALPQAPPATDGWSAGTPDGVFAMQEPFNVPAEGVVEYQFFDVPMNLAEDKWVRSIEVRPGARSVVHHVIVWIRLPQSRQRPVIGRADRTNFLPEEERRSRNLRRPRGDFLAGIGVGTNATVFRAGTAKLIPAGSSLVFEIHYTPNGTAGEDRTSIGLRYAAQAPAEEIRTVTILNETFEIPPGAADHRVDGGLTFVSDVKIRSIMAHTHVRGKKWLYTLEYPDGRQQVILDIPKFDFNWQTEYVFAEPLRVPKGARLVASAWYDNSKANPSNPDPATAVRWGDQTWEEMHFSVFNVSLDNAQPTARQ